MKFFVYSVLALGLVSCGKKSEDTPAPSAESAFFGTWETACLPIAGTSLSLKVTAAFGQDKTQKNDVVGYSDAACTTKSYQVSSKSTFAVIGDGEQSSKGVEFTLVELKTTYFDEATISVANSSKMCESSTWSSGVAVDCTDKRVSENSSQELDAAQKKGAKSNSLLKVEGSKLTIIASGIVYTKK